MTHDHNHDHSMVHDHRDVQGGAIRAAIFGVSDGLVSNSALIIGVAAANLSGGAVLLTGISGLLAGATSMAAGEFVSMKAQNELIERELKIEKVSLEENPEKETKELQAIYMSRGLEKHEAKLLADAIHRNPEVALEVHAREELGVDPDNIGNPAKASVSSFSAFSFGAFLPLIPWLFIDGTPAIIVSLFLAIISAAMVGVILANFTERSKFTTALRQVIVAVVACGVTSAIGSLFHL